MNSYAVLASSLVLAISAIVVALIVGRDKSSSGSAISAEIDPEKLLGPIREQIGVIVRRLDETSTITGNCGSMRIPEERPCPNCDGGFISYFPHRGCWYCDSCNSWLGQNELKLNFGPSIWPTRIADKEIDDLGDEIEDEQLLSRAIRNLILAAVMSQFQ